MQKVLCIGELLIDFVCTDPDVSLTDGVNFIKKAGGAPANVCVALQKMGTDSCFLGSVGEDPFGDFLEQMLQHYGVNCDGLKKCPHMPTTMAYVSLQSNGERDFYFYRNADQHYRFEDIDPSILERCEIFHFGSATAFLGGDLEETYFKLLSYAREHQKIISFDPNYREMLFADKKEKFIVCSKQFLAHADFAKLSEEEALLLANTTHLDDAAAYLHRISGKTILITLGENGTLLYHREGKTIVPTTKVKMVDATGAGDAFIGAFLSQVSEHIARSHQAIPTETLRSYIAFANRVGALTVQHYGGAESIPERPL